MTVEPPALPRPRPTPEPTFGGARAYRPGQVIAAAVLVLLQALVAVGIGIAMVLDPRGQTGAQLSSAAERIYGVVTTGYGAALLVVCVGLLLLRGWALVASYVLEGVLAALFLLLLVLGGDRGGAVVGLLFTAGTLVLLLRPVARGSFASG